MSPLPALVALLACPLTAQAVHHVGLGGFAEIRDAIVAAAPGDVIEVEAGNYAPFVLDKALTITALPSAPGTIVQVINQSVTPAVTVLRPPVGTRAFVTGIHFRNIIIWFWRMDTRVERGTVAFEECTFEGHSESPEAALRVSNAEVVLRRCLLLGGTGNFSGSPGLQCDNSSVFATDCFVRAGALSIEPFRAGSDGIAVTSCRLHLVRTDVVGGDSNGIPCQSGYVAGHGIGVSGASTVWLADCTLRGGDGMCAPGGHGLRNTSTTAVQLARTTLTAGNGTPPGQPSVGPTVTQPLLGLNGGTVGLVRGQSWLANYRTQPGWPILVLFAPDLTVSIDARVAERLLLPPANVATFALLIADGAGNAALQTTVPPLASLLHQRAFLQAFSGFALPLRTAPPLGGVIR